MPRKPTFRRPFQATPVRLGNVYRLKQRRSRVSRGLRTVGLLAAVALAVFGVGVVATNWSSVGAAIGGTTADTVQFGECGVIRRNCVIDGDTFWLDGRKVRIADIDTPEISEPKCPSEYERGMQAKHRLRDLLNAGPIELEPVPGRDRDQYGRDLRIVVRGGRSIGDQLVSEGLARTWTGRREPWC
jgi:micrococcal nuclease